jgi:serine/threonine-protein kinase
MPARVDTTLSRPLADRLGQVIAARYRVRGLIAKGGVGAVYEVEHLETGAHLAIKMLLPGFVGAAEIVKRFEREAMATSRLAHPNIVEVIDLVAEDADLYLVMERLRGTSLTEAIEAGALAPRRALVIARQVLEGLAHAHQRGIIHRDIKPDNLILEIVGEPGREHERVKLLDFGLVKLVGDAAAELGGDRLTASGAVFGTPAYLSPEQALGRTVDARTDLYSLGVVMFEMLTGRKPYTSPDPATLVRMHVSAPIPSLSGPAWCTPALEQVVACALAKDPAARFEDAARMIAALDAAFVSLDHLPATI